MIQNDQLRNLILRGEFHEAGAIALQMEREERQDLLLQIGFDEDSITVYTFSSYLLMMQETAELHDLAFQLLIHPLCHLEGAYFAALHHVRRGIELEPEDIGWKEHLLFLSITPDEVVSREDAAQVAQQILAVQPDNQAALEFLASTQL